MKFLKRNSRKEQKEETSFNETPVRKKKKNEKMSSVLDESTLEPALESMAQNKAFMILDDEQAMFATLLLKAEDLGGLNQKASSKNPDIGALVQQLKNQTINNLITADMMEKEEILIIPDENTVAEMDGFQMLRDLTYPVVLVREDGLIDPLDQKLTFSQVEAISQNKTTLLDQIELDEDDFPGVYQTSAGSFHPAMESLPDGEDLPSFYDPSFTQANEQPADDAPYSWDASELPVFPEDVSHLVTFDEEYPYPDEYYMEQPAEDPQPQEMPQAEPVKEETAQVQEPREEEPAQDIQVRREDFERQVEQLCALHEPRLSVSHRPLNDKFDDSFVLTLFPEDRTELSGQMGEYLNELSRQANDQMKRQNAEHRAQLSSVFSALMSQAFSELTQQTSFDNPDSDFGKAAMRAQQNKEKALSSSELDRREAARRKRLNDQFEHSMEQAALAGAARAREDYRIRNERRHREELEAIRTQLVDEVESRYADEMNRLDRKRAEVVNERTQLIYAAALKSAGKLRSEQMEQEKQLRSSWSQKLEDYIRDHRAEDLSRQKVLEAQVSQDRRVEQLHQEQSARIQALQADYEQKSADLLDENKSLRRRQKEEVKRLNRHYEITLDQKTRQIADLSSANSDLQKKLIELADRKEEEFQSVKTRLESEIQSLKSENESIQKARRNYGITLAAISIIAVLAAGGFGMLFGFNRALQENAPLSRTLEQISETAQDDSSTAEESSDKKAEAQKTDKTDKNSETKTDKDKDASDKKVSVKSDK